MHHRNVESTQRTSLRPATAICKHELCGGGVFVTLAAGAVNCVRLSHDDRECLSAGADGSCIVWNLDRGVRANVMFASCLTATLAQHD